VLDRVTFSGFHALAGGHGRPLVFLHGFPDCPATAVPFLEQLIARGFRVLAPYLRGYAPSPLAGPFDLATLASDVRSIIAAWIDEPVSLVGHDWGAALTYALCQDMPVARAVTLAVPPPAVFLRQLRTPRQIAHSWYMAFFQLPGSSRLVGTRFIDRLWRRWSPGFTLDEPRRAELHACMAASLPAPLEYYRAFRRTLFDRDFQRALRQPTATEILALHGADDGCVLPPRGSDIVADVGHFLHLEAPAAIADRVAGWLA
jgi:pimeloyl-ACP methyl ester carboxylesterase